MSALALSIALTSSAEAADAASAAPASVPVDAFFSRAEMDTPRLSPDGDAVAILVRNKAGRRQLAVIDTADLTKARIVVSFEEFDVSWARWVDSRRLVFSLGDETESAWQYRGSGLYAIERDGSDLRTLINFRGHNIEVGTAIKVRSLEPYTYSFGQTLRDGSGDIVIYHWSHTTPLGQIYGEWTGNAPLRLNTRTGTISDVAIGKLPDFAYQWAIDGQGHARAAVATHDGTSTVFTPDAAGTWQERSHFPTYARSEDEISVDAIGAEGQVYVTKPAGGAKALFRLDTTSGRTEADPVVRARGFDISGDLVQDYRSHKVLGVHYLADAAGTVWFDADLKALQAKVDARLPGLVNIIDAADCGCARRVLVTSFSDRQPKLFFLFDRSDDTLIPIGSARPDVSPRQMADTDFYRIKARDGGDLPVYVTKPHGKGPWPTVVLVHGGPWVRGWDWSWDGESQFLASRGYLVVKPEFRGTTGYGSAVQSGGDKQWGLKMQDDIADATTWAASQGLADSKRTCIAGASYGGYATLMGLVRYPDLYRCGVAWAAVTDINLMYDINWSDMDSQWKGFGMPMLIGDQSKDSAQLTATSPLAQAARIQRPLLLAHGGIDRRVPIAHAVKMRNALQAAHAPPDLDRIRGRSAWLVQARDARRFLPADGGVPGGEHRAGQRPEDGSEVTSATAGRDAPDTKSAAPIRRSRDEGGQAPTRRPPTRPQPCRAFA